MYRLCRHWLPARTSWIAVMLYVFYYAHSSSQSVGQQDAYALGLVLLCTQLMVRSEEPGFGTIVTVGLLFGLATLFRPTNVLYEAVLFLCLRKPRGIGNIFIAFVATSLPFLAVIIYYATLPGGLIELYRSIILFNLDLYSRFHAPIYDFARGLVRILIVEVPFLAFFVFYLRRSGSLASQFERQPEKKIVILYWSYLALTIGIIILQRKFLVYHFAPYVMLQTPVAAIGAEKLLSFIKPRYRIAVFMGFGLMAVLPVTRLQEIGWGSRIGHRSFLEAMDSAEYPGELTGFSAVKHTVDYLAPAVRAGKRIEVMSFDSRLRASLRANSATRFTVMHSIGARTEPGKTGEQYYTDFQHIWRKEFMDSLEIVRPYAIVLARTTDYWYMKDPYNDVLHGLPGFDNFFFTNYRFDTAFGGYQVFRLKGN
jgi:hypothetical protein